jgi:hypothetical protein
MARRWLAAGCGSWWELRVSNGEVARLPFLPLYYCEYRPDLLFFVFNSLQTLKFCNYLIYQQHDKSFHIGNHAFDVQNIIGNICKSLYPKQI